MKNLIVLLGLLLASTGAWANACTTSSTGNFRSVTWASCGSTYPHEADSFTISAGGVVTIPNGEVDQAGADPANGTTLNITVTGTGSELVVANGGQLEAHSSILITTHAGLILGTGIVLTWATTNGAAPIYSLQFQGTTTPYAFLTMTGTNSASVGFNTATLSVIGLAVTNPTTYWNMTSVSYASTISLTWALLNNCGTNVSVQVECAKMTGGMTVNHVLLNNSSGFEMQGTVAGDHNFNYMHVRNTKDDSGNNNSMFYLVSTAAQGANIRQLTNSTFYNPNAQAGDASTLIQEPGVQVSNLVSLASFNMVNSSGGGTDATAVNGMVLGPVSTSDLQPYTVTTAGTGVTMQHVIVAQSCHAAGSVGQANVLRENNANTVGASAIPNVYTDWMIFGPTLSGCNSGNGNWGGWIVQPGDSFPSGSTISTAGSVIQNFGVFNTAGTLVNNSASGAGFVNTYTKIRNATIYNNITGTTSGNGQINIEGAISTASANKILEISTVWMDNTNSGITPGIQSYVGQAAMTWENNNFTNPVSNTGSSHYLFGWNGNKNIAGSICYSNSAAYLCYTSDGTATVSSVSSGPPCVLTISGLSGAVGIGDYAYKTSGVVLPVTNVSGSNVTLGYDTSGSQSCGGMVATNTVLFGKSLWSAGTNYYGQPSTTGYGASDTALQPNWGNSSATVYTWSTNRGGAGTLDDARNRWSTYVDGIPLDGDNCPDGSTPAPYCAAQTPGDSWQDFSAWAHWSFTIYNGQAAHAGYKGIDPGINGVYNPTVIN